MTTVAVRYDKDSVREVVVKGHTGYAKAGKDIVCAAISAITQTALMSVIEFSSEKVDYETNDDAGFMRFSVPEAQGEEKIKIQAVLQAMILGLRDIEKGYGAFVKVEVK